MKEQKILIENLKSLALKSKELVKENATHPSLRLTETIYFYDEILDFQYNADGSTYSKSQSKYVSEKRFVLSQEILNLIKSTFEYDQVLKTKDDNQEYFFADVNLLDRFIEVIANDHLDKESDLAEDYIDSIVRIFYGDLEKKFFKFGIIAEVYGIIVQFEEELKFNSNNSQFTIRQTRVNDLQKKHTIYPYLSTIPKPLNSGILPSAIINVEIDEVAENDFNLARNELEKLISTFRLFGVSSVQRNYYEMYSEAVLWDQKANSAAYSGQKINVLAKINLSKDDLPKFIHFYKNISCILPRRFCDPGLQEKDRAHLTIAYKHYCDALLANDSLEEKITNVVIGLESLLLAENQENSFRFWVRGAKILNLLGYSALAVKNNLKTAYGVRSLFVHGDDLGLEKELKKLNTDLKSSNDFLIELLDHLRVLIIATILLSQNETFTKINKGVKIFEKKKLLGIVDDSLIDKESEQKLESFLSSVKSLISI